MFVAPTRRFAVALFVCFAVITATASQVTVKVADPQGTPVKSALVIVQDLRSKDHEVFRELTGDNGALAPHALSPGLYRAIAVFPYGPWRTGVREFLVRNDPLTVELQLTPLEQPLDVPIAIGQLTLHVLDANGRPAVGARVLVRDNQADPGSEHWGVTDAQGNTTLVLSMDPAMLVVVYRDTLFTYPTDGFQRERTLQLK